MAIYDDVILFLNDREPWMQDLARRIAVQPELTEDDFAEVLANLKSTEGLAEQTTMEALSNEHLANRSLESHLPTKLVSISNVENANQLVPNQTMLFAQKGLTLIYGYNGSGKTGYGRILKQTCRSRRSKQEPILGNVYSTSPVKPAKASVSYSVGDSPPTTIAWEDGKPVPSDLSRISVFDADTAPLYADQQNKIEFLPLGLDILPRIGKACEAIAKKLDGEVELLGSSLTVLPDYTNEPYRSAAQRLKPTTPFKDVPKEEELIKLSSWSTTEDAEVARIEQEIAATSQPATLAARNRRLAVALNSISTRLRSACGLVNGNAIASYKKLLEDSVAAREAARMSSSGRFDAEPLGKLIGGEAWRKLYEAAEAFSSEAYPGVQFPVTGPDRVCVLCQQSLSAEASDRLVRFREFVHDVTQKNAAAAEQAVRDSIGALNGMSHPGRVEIEVQLSELQAMRSDAAALVDDLKGLADLVNSAKIAALAALARAQSFEAISTPDVAVVTAADSLVSVLQREAKQLDDAVGSTAVLQRLREAHEAVLTRKKFSQDRTTILGRRATLEKIDKLRRCRTKCDTTAISRKGSDLRDKYLTADFRNKIANEVKNLELDYLPLIVEGRTEKGSSYIGVALNKSRPARASSVLSEGEFRGLALACFFAEISSIPGHDGIVVDDPVSSLDHMHAAQVAARLVQEAGRRPQVVVFTHDLSFYYELYTRAAMAAVPVYRNWIYSGEGFGYIASNEGPWESKNVNQRIGELKKQLEQLPGAAKRNPDAYLRAVEEFYARLRQTWERLVEERLLNGVSGRFQSGVQTQSLAGVTVDDSDYSKIYFGMKKASEYSGHDRPVGRNVSPPPMTTIAEHLKELEDYLAVLKKRSEDTAKKRRALHSPPKAEVLGAGQAGGPR